MTMLAESVEVVIGVDTHKHTHTAAVVTAATGALLEQLTVETDPAGYAALVELADRHSSSRAWAMEGTGSYGAQLNRLLEAAGETVVEVERPHRPARRNGAKSDDIDAVRAAKDALSRPHNATPRAAGERQALSVLLAARRSSIESATTATLQLLALITASPEILRGRFRGLNTRAAQATAVKLRINPRWDIEVATTARTLRALARRVEDLKAEAAEHDKQLTTIVKSWRPDLLDQLGVGPFVAAIALCSWSHPGRCRSEASFAALAGVSPIPASSGQTTRYRLNRCGDRQLNRALHIITMHRMRHDPATIAYAERRRAEGKTDRDIRRCLKRYIARQLYRQLEQPVDDL